MPYAPYRLKDVPVELRKEFKALQNKCYDLTEFQRGRVDSREGRSTARSANGARLSGFDIEHKILRAVL